MTPHEGILIVGGSAAGLSAADGLREGGYQGPVTVLNEETRAPYDRPTVSKGLLVGEGAPEFMDLRSTERLEETNITLRSGETAAGLDIDRHYLITMNGEPMPWESIIIATGARARTIRTTDGKPLPVLRTASNLIALRAALTVHRRIALVGAGFIGLEVASGLAESGVIVDVFDNKRLPLEPLIGPEIAGFLQELHASRGVNMHGDITLSAITGDEGEYVLHFSDGSSHQTPLVLVGIGVEPNVDWLVNSGVELSDGVVTDEFGRTNVANVWAAGDVAALEHPLLESRSRVEHWTHAIEHGRRVGLNIARGDLVPFTTPPYFWSDQYGMRFHSYGRRRPEDDVVFVKGSPSQENFLALFGSHGEFHGLFSNGYEQLLRPYRKLLERGASFDEACTHITAR
ncbi:NAD(P)/FAD-dependent oxidoreductase [Nocardia sp. NPDC050412]|uniref:NAD(P)/FAD-dependent oxidoreductase n=1 Tax=Nocardia sp. NPDC050412 TaxID=3364320 RepID=UPI0037AD4887